MCRPSGQPISIISPLLIKNYFPLPSLNLLFFSVKTITPCPSAAGPAKMSVPFQDTQHISHFPAAVADFLLQQDGCSVSAPHFCRAKFIFKFKS